MGHMARMYVQAASQREQVLPRADFFLLHHPLKCRGPGAPRRTGCIPSADVSHQLWAVRVIGRIKLLSRYRETKPFFLTVSSFKKIPQYSSV